jgi:MoaA/NifB/PqqE/SkfB family radical SAM enzyme
LTLTGLHVLLTYGCTYECDHCFVWSSPRQTATFTLPRLDDLLRQAKALGTVEWLYFEGGEPFLYHALLRWGVHRAYALGFKVGVVSNAYWASSDRDAEEWLGDLAGLVKSLEMSCDGYHGDDGQERRIECARAAAERLGIPASVLRVASPERAGVPRSTGQPSPGESRLMFRGRAAEALGRTAPRHLAAEFTECPYEDLREPGRVHVDPFGHVHLCQGISLGNVFATPLAAIVRDYDPDAHPIAGPLLAGGPAELARRHDHDLRGGWADACHLCYTTRRALRPLYPAILAPDAMYGVES